MKKILPALLAGMLALSLTACGAAGGVHLTMGTGSHDGVYNSYGEALSQVMMDGTGFQISTRETEGSKDNLQGLDSDKFQLGLVQSDVMTYAWQGRRSFEQVGRVDSFRTVAGLYQEALQLVTMDPEITEVEDLKGRTVSVGAEGSGVYFSAFDVLTAAGLSMNDIIPVYQGFQESTQALRDREIDAAFIVAGTPTPAVTELCRVDVAYLVPIDPVTGRNLLKYCPFYTECVIPAGTYLGQEKDVKTVGVTATLVASADVPDDDVYGLTKALIDRKAELSKLHGMGKELNLERATEVRTAPFHPGAIEYYREQGIDLK